MAAVDQSVEMIGRSIQHPNPLFDFLTVFVPRKLKTLFKYCEYLYYNSPQVFAALNKFAIYPVTDVNYHTENPTLKGKYRKLLEETLKIKTVLVKTGIDRHVYGNSFVSLYFPFRRFLKCPSCGNTRNIKYIKSFKFRIRKKKTVFQMVCSECHNSVRAEVEDKKLRFASGINVIRWDPKQIEIEKNPITGDTQFYYQIPDDIQSKVRKGDRHLIETMPLAFLECIAARKIFKFGKNRLYHMKADAPAGIDNRWGFPGLASTLKQFFYVAVLRKANEAIALEHVVPFRVLHPQQNTASADPTMTISLSNWANETKLNLKAWRKDPLHLMFSPIPLGVTQLGGQGRALMVTGEITEAENGIIASLGIPREFLYGGLSATGSGVTLRMLENQLLNYTSELVEEAQWIADQVATYMGWTKVKLGLEPFKLVDDVQQKMMLMQANQSSNGVLFSNTSMAQMFGRNLEKERDMRMQESLDEQRFQMELQSKTDELSSNLAEQSKSQAAQGGSQPHYDQQQMLAEAQNIAMQLSQAPPNIKQSQMHQLQTEDVVMYALVTFVMKQMSQSQTQEAKAMAAQGGGEGGM
jgi:hypothetical protein